METLDLTETALPLHTGEEAESSADSLAAIPMLLPLSHEGQGLSEGRNKRRHEQAKFAVKEYIRTNNLQTGSRLPTEEALCRQFGWSRTTIVRALNDLADDGMVNRVKGSGTYVASPQEKRSYRILVTTRPQTENDDYCAPLLSGLLQAASSQGVNIAYHPQTVPSLEVLQNQEVDGVLAVAWGVDDLRKFLLIHNAGIPIVGLAHRSRSHKLPLICVDNFAGMQQVVDHLLQCGHRNIAYVCANLANSDAFERFCAYQSTLAGAGVVPDIAYVQAQMNDESREVAFLETWWESMNPRPSAMVIDAPDAPAVLAMLSRRQLKIPEEISIVITDDRAALRHHWPPLTMMRQPVQELGKRGLAKLLAMIRGEDEGNPEILPVELIHGESVQKLDARQ
jgi:DNA-binding LacI/PurR family transcriptional regulator